ncbi:PA2778 family cysteine peptidase [Hydrogenovibrio sp.]|uniref:PA2778 family cysteine peptidase n=1 Tax=Hydrogenovibrio sp. TaxID=2065821 RepID=UPI002870B29E|nr:PA2778 family cysteine peptidase [Hydrogenovibrio sp.]
MALPFPFYRARLWLGVFLSASLMALSGCGSLPHSQELTVSPQQAELTQVPFYAQTKYQCGPAALATVLQHRDQNVLPDDLVSRVYTPQKQGSLQVDMIGAARQQGLVPYPLEPNMQALLTEVAQGNPVLVMQNLRFGWWPLWHYAVVVGYDLSENEVVLRSGETKRRVTTLGTFERTWQRADYWALVVVEPDRIPATANHQAWLKTAFDLEQTGQKAAALTAYQTGWQTWPQSAQLGMALANLHYQQGQYDSSSQTFAALSRRHGQQAMVWNNWAYALKAQGCKHEAHQAAQCARQLAPDDPDIQSTSQEMQTSARPEPDCPRVQCPTVRSEN